MTPQTDEAALDVTECPELWTHPGNGIVDAEDTTDPTLAARALWEDATVAPQQPDPAGSSMGEENGWELP